MRKQESGFPKLEDISDCTHLRIWHCKFKSLEPISQFSNLEELVIATYLDKTFEFLRGLQKLRYLSILHLPKINDLTGIESLSEIQSLSLRTLPSWDHAGKTQIVQSLEPISGLDKLEHLELLGVVAKDKSLHQIEKCKSLKTARISKYPEQEVTRFIAARKVANKLNPRSSFAESPGKAE